jgi:hypothetical protein
MHKEFMTETIMFRYKKNCAHYGFSLYRAPLASASPPSGMPSNALQTSLCPTDLNRWVLEVTWDPGRGSAIGRVILSIEIEDLTRPQLTLVDIPGLIDAEIKGAT